jgi:hypothetical protein
VTAPRRMLLNAFHMNCVSHIQQGLWVRDETRQLDYPQLDPWVELAQIGLIPTLTLLANSKSFSFSRLMCSQA